MVERCDEYLCRGAAYYNHVIVITVNRHFIDAQLTKIITKAPTVTTVLSNRQTAK